MTKLDLIEYHLNKVKYYKQVNYDLRHADNKLKIGVYKESYNRAVRKYRKKLKWHHEAIIVLERMNE